MADAPLVVVDASVAVKWFVSADEDGVDEAAFLLDAQSEGSVRLVAPSLMIHELFNVLNRGGREAPGLREAMDAFFDSGVGLIAPDRELMDRAAVHVERHGSSSFDAAYSALAQTLGCELATADRKLARMLAGVVDVRLV